MAHIKIKKNEVNPETKEILAEAIVRISESLERLASSGVNEEAIIILLHDHTKIAKRDIKLIFSSLRKLRSWYCR